MLPIETVLVIDNSGNLITTYPENSIEKDTLLSSIITALLDTIKFLTNEKISTLYLENKSIYIINLETTFVTIVFNGFASNKFNKWIEIQIKNAFSGFGHVSTSNIIGSDIINLAKDIIKKFVNDYEELFTLIDKIMDKYNKFLKINPSKSITIMQQFIDKNGVFSLKQGEIEFDYEKLINQKLGIEDIILRARKLEQAIDNSLLENEFRFNKNRYFVQPI